ncbi:outer membrane lipoprotein-sorting protein [Salipaludibacillus daqingensis]|uniref:outer membrane lipoprotein-sorting protein n=1 Tax=Salipaludibacillus daqingensis TaxID=3041001 RepID=UPI0024768C29|nr:outer membrane lipoprotein-sorting protein [Salipaludibacillus daqingensis]
MKRNIFLFGSFSFAFLLSACAVEDTEQIVENAVAAQEDLESYYAEVTSSFVFDGEEETMNYKEWIIKPDHYRTEMDDGHIFVSDGEQSWSYDEENNTVMVNENISEELPDETPDESDMIRQMLTEMLNSNEVIAEGKETIADRSTFHLSLTPIEDKEDSIYSNNYEIWIDEETYLPLKMIWEDDDFRSETIYHHIEYNIDIDMEKFTFDIPEDAEIQSMDNYMPESLTLDELDEATDFDLPDFDGIPESYQFQDAMQFDNVNESMIEFIDNSGNYLMLSLFKEGDSHPIENDDSEEDVEIGRYEGSYSYMYDMQFLRWDTGQFTIELIASDDELSQDELIEIAEGIR